MVINIHSNITQCINRGAVLCVTVGREVRHKIRNQLKKVKTLAKSREVASGFVALKNQLPFCFELEGVLRFPYWAGGVSKPEHRRVERVATKFKFHIMKVRKRIVLVNRLDSARSFVEGRLRRQRPGRPPHSVRTVRNYGCGQQSPRILHCASYFRS